MRTAPDALRVLAAHGLPGATDRPLKVDSLDQLLILADTQRVLPHVYKAVTDGRLANATGPWVATLRDRTIAAAGTTLAAHGAAVELQRRLVRLGIDDAVVLKGCATAYLDYPEPTDRFSSDVDVLLGSTSYDVLLAASAECERPVERSSRWERDFGHATTLSAEDRVSIDAHVRLAPGYVGLSIPGDEPLRSTVGYVVGGQRLAALDGPGRLLHAALHAKSGPLSLHSARDVPQLVLASDVDWEEAVARATAWRVDHFFALGVATTWQRFDLPPHPIWNWAQRHRPAGRQRLVRLIAGNRLRGNVIAGPCALPVRKWPAYVIPLLFPQRAYAASYDRGWRRRAEIVRRELGRPLNAAPRREIPGTPTRHG